MRARIVERKRRITNRCKVSEDFFEELDSLVPDLESEANYDTTGVVEAGLAKLAALVEDLNRDLSTSTILDRAMSAAIELTGAERGFLVLVGENGEWNFRVARNMEQVEIEDAEKAASHTVIRKVLENRRPLLINDVVGASNLTKQQSIANMQVRSIMGAPLIAKGKLLGAAYVDTSRLAGVFDHTSLVLFESFVQLAAVALENARLIEAEQDAKSRYRELQEYLDTVLKSQPHGVVILDGDLRVEYANPQASRMMGGEPLESGTNFSNCRTCGDEMLLRVMADLQDFLLNDSVTHRIIQCSNSVLSYSFFHVQKSRDGRMRVGLIFEDITHQKELERKLIESEKRSTVNQLAGGIAHEINNSLQPVKGRVELLQMRLKRAGVSLDGGVDKDLDTISSLTTRIEKIARNLRHLTKPANPEFGPLNVKQLIISTVELMETTTGRLRGFMQNVPDAPLRLVLDLEDNLPPIRGDQHGLESALINLILNACHAIDEKGEGELTIGAHLVNGQVVVSVADTGVGIDPEVLPHIFEPYFTTRGEEGGTGLGMSILQNIAEIHSAKLDLDSRYGEGTRVTLAFPVMAATVNS